jgi:hypothetical protein
VVNLDDRVPLLADRVGDLEPRPNAIVDLPGRAQVFELPVWTLAMLLPVAVGMMLALSELDRWTRVRA